MPPALRHRSRLRVPERMQHYISFRIFSANPSATPAGEAIFSLLKSVSRIISPDGRPTLKFLLFLQTLFHPSRLL